MSRRAMTPTRHTHLANEGEQRKTNMAMDAQLSGGNDDMDRECVLNKLAAMSGQI